MSTLNLFFPRSTVVSACSNFSGFSTPHTSKFLPVCFTPKTIHPPAALANAETVSQIFFGSSERASFTSKSSHSMSVKRVSSSGLFINH
jgi:hypothetical protein